MHEGAKVFPECFASGQIRFIFPAMCRAVNSFKTNSNILFVSFDSESTLQSETKRTGWHPVDDISGMPAIISCPAACLLFPYMCTLHLLM